MWNQTYISHQFFRVKRDDSHNDPTYIAVLEKYPYQTEMKVSDACMS